MDASRYPGGRLVLAVLVISLVGVVVVPGVLAQSADGEANSGDGFGAQISAHLQSSAADADSSIEAGLWESSMSADSSPAAAVERRARALETRLDRLEERSEKLRARRTAGNLSAVAYTATASAVHAQLANVRSAIDRAQRVAANHGVEDHRLEALRTRAGNATGPEVGETARSLAAAGRGPPTTPPGQRTNGSAGPPTDAPGPDETGAADGTPGPDRSSDPGADRGEGQAGSPGTDEGDGRDAAGGDGQDGQRSDGGDSDGDNRDDAGGGNPGGGGGSGGPP